MQGIETDKLRNAVIEILGRVDSLASTERYRCYEYARRLRDGLAGMGYVNTFVENGLVTYQAVFLRSALAPKNVQADWIDEELSKITSSKEFFHSWLRSGDIIVDFHRNIRLRRGFGVENLLLVHREDELEGQVEYVRNAHEFNLEGEHLFTTHLYI